MNNKEVTITNAVVFDKHVKEIAMLAEQYGITTDQVIEIIKIIEAKKARLRK